MRNVKCPKCGSADYFLGKRNVSGAILKILRTKQVPICKKCDEIMVATVPTIIRVNRVIGNPKLIIGLIAFLLLAVILGSI